MKPTLIPEIINSQEIKILDENNIPVELARKSQFKFNPTLFLIPNIIIDNFEKRNHPEIEIRRIELPFLNRLGYRLVSVEIKKSSMRNRAGQQRAYIIKENDAPLENGYELDKTPKEHYLEMDVVGNRIRLKGRNAYPYVRNENASQWIEVEEDD